MATKWSIAIAKESAASGNLYHSGALESDEVLPVEELEE
jgi:hypothetical protein